ncbi:MAG TPA: carotenoid oxygenase family protein [Myxococcota bacterium]|nr:carotenoid oxygenase family protein [Myxococcota bacterium]
MRGFPSDDPFLGGLYAPWPMEGDVHDCEVEGEIPEALHGTFYRNGPNPQFPPRSAYHWFDGDAMVHAFSFEAGRCRYRNRWIRTEKWRAERAAGESLFGGLSDMTNNDPRAEGVSFNAANTHLWPHAGRFLALFEGGPPTEIDAETLATVGVHDFDGKLVGAMTAHPHTDPTNGEMVFFGYAPVPPFLRHHVAAADGTLARSEIIDVPFPSMMHDAVVTREHVVFLCCPATFRPENLASRTPIRWEPELGTRLGVMPRGGTSDDVRWFETDPCYVFHVMNGFDDGPRVVADVCRFDRLPIFEREGQALDDAKPPRLARWTFDLEAGTLREEGLDDRSCEFPRIDDRFAGQPYRFGLAAGYAEGDRSEGLFDRVVRYDHARATRSEWRFPGPVSEPVFVPRDDAAAEGEGFVVALYVRDDTARAEVAVLDAEHLAGGPLATVKLPHRIPHGFHANFLRGVTLR